MIFYALVLSLALATKQIFSEKNISFSNSSCIKRLTLSEGSDSLPEEIKILRLLQSSQVVQILNTTADASFFYVEMERCDMDFFDVIERFNFLPERVARIYLAELIVGLEFMHSKEIIHGDLKSENILLSRNGRLKIADFGLSCTFDSASSRIGTLSCTAPEIFQGEKVSAQSDWWAFAVLAYELCTGQDAFSVDDIFSQSTSRSSSERSDNDSCSSSCTDFSDEGVSSFVEVGDQSLESEEYVEVNRDPIFDAIKNLILEYDIVYPAMKPALSLALKDFLSKFFVPIGQRNFPVRDHEWLVCINFDAFKNSDFQGPISIVDSDGEYHILEDACENFEHE